MDHVLSTHLFVNQRLTSALLTRIQSAGIGAVEIFCGRQHFDYRNKAQVTELGHWFKDSGLTLHSLHSPMFSDEIWGRSGPHAVVNLTEPVKSKRLVTVDEIKRALETAELIPCRYLIQHIGVAGEEFDLRKFIRPAIEGLGQRAGPLSPPIDNHRGQDSEQHDACRDVQKTKSKTASAELARQIPEGV
jgi:sugar phosphate isomerase/epimerase